MTAKLGVIRRRALTKYKIADDPLCVESMNTELYKNTSHVKNVCLSYRKLLHFKRAGVIVRVSQ